MVAYKQRWTVGVLVQEVDKALQQTYRQSLKEVVQDLTLRHAFRSAHPSNTEILRTLYETGVLRMSGSSATGRLHAALGRFTRRAVGTCVRCGGSIEMRQLGTNAGTRLCAQCQRQHSKPA